MANYDHLNSSWLERLTNPNHDGITQQIDDSAMAYVTDNARFIEKRNAVHQCRQREDAVWLVVQRDPAVNRLANADNREDAYISAMRYTNLAHANLPDDEPTKAEAKECEQVFKDFKFRTDNNYGAEADKIIQMQQNFAPHQEFLTQIGAWTFFTKAVEQAYLVRELLLERAQTEGEFVKGEMKNARAATDAAIADLFRTIDAMMDLMPSPELTALYNRMKGLEIYAKKYNLPGSSSSSNQNNQNNSENSGEENGGDSGDNGGGLPPSGGGETGGDDNNGDDNGGGLPPSGGGETGGDTGGGDTGGGGLPPSGGEG